MLEAYTQAGVHDFAHATVRENFPRPSPPLVFVWIPTPRAWFRWNATFNGKLDGSKTTTWNIACVSREASGRAMWAAGVVSLLIVLIDCTAELIGCLYDISAVAKCSPEAGRAAGTPLLFIDEGTRRKCVCSPALLWNKPRGEWTAVISAAAAHHILSFLLSFSSGLLLVLIAFISWIWMSCTHINETHTSLAGRRYLLLDCLQCTGVAAETLGLFHSCCQLLLCIEPAGIS